MGHAPTKTSDVCPVHRCTGQINRQEERGHSHVLQTDEVAKSIKCSCGEGYSDMSPESHKTELSCSARPVFSQMVGYDPQGSHNEQVVTSYLH